MAAVRHRRPETRARRVTAALAGPSAVVCALVVLIAWVSQGRPGPTPWVGTPPAAAAPPWVTASPSPAPPSPSATPIAARSLAADVKAHPSKPRARSRPVARRTTKPARTKATPGKAGPKNPVGGLLGSIFAWLLGHGHGHRPRGR